MTPLSSIDPEIAKGGVLMLLSGPLDSRANDYQEWSVATCGSRRLRFRR